VTADLTRTREPRPSAPARTPKGGTGNIRRQAFANQLHQMPQIRSCRARDLSGDPWTPIDCPLISGASGLPGCAKCEAYLFVSRMRDEMVKQGKPWLPLWAVAQRLRKSTIVSDHEWQQALNRLAF